MLIYGVLKGVKVEADTHTHYCRIFALDKLRELGMFWLGLSSLELGLGLYKSPVALEVIKISI